MTDIMRLTIEIERVDGLYYATSPQVKGLLVAENSLAEVCAKVPVAIAELRQVAAEHGSRDPYVR